jgi:hypothetical protein
MEFNWFETQGALPRACFFMRNMGCEARGLGMAITNQGSG